MLAILVKKGTKYACNLESQIRSLDTIMLTSWAPHSLLFPCKEGAGRSTYLCPCPLDYLCLQSFSKGTIYACNNRKFLLGDSSRNQSHVNSGQFTTLQPYSIPVERDCKRIQSVWDLRLQSYVVHPYRISVTKVTKSVPDICLTFSLHNPSSTQTESKSKSNSLMKIQCNVDFNRIFQRYVKSNGYVKMTNW